MHDRTPTEERRNDGELRGALLAGIAWTAVAVFAAVFAVRDGDRQVDELSVNQSRTLFQTIVDFRAWNASHGGVYVPVDDATRPNPYLDVPHRDVVTTDGIELTLVNPAFMTRQFSELSHHEEGIEVHITSLEPLRPENAADPWERVALEEFEAGATEVWAYDDESPDRPVFRYMAPLFVEPECLPCHEAQGYREGDIRGGISITHPAALFVAAKVVERRNRLFAAFLAWAMGLAIIAAVARSFWHKRQTLEKVRELSLVDSLTAVHNRRGFATLAEQSMRSIARRDGKAVIAFFDIDHFKSVNDRFGHKEGDAALRRVARLLRRTFRASDIVARVGGDEFVALLMDASWNDAEVVRARIEEAVARENTRPDVDYALSLSVGLVEFDPSLSKSLEDLIKEADQAMYRDKKRKTPAPASDDGTATHR